MCMRTHTHTHRVILGNYVVAQSPGHIQFFVTPCPGSTPGLFVPHHLLKSAQAHVHCIGDAIQPSHPLMPSSSLAFNLSLHQTFPMSQLFTSDDQNTAVSTAASVFPMNIQG